MQILYIGDDSLSSTSRHRADALRRLGHDVAIWNPEAAVSGLRKIGVLQKLHNISGQVLLVGSVQRWLAGKLKIAEKHDLIWVNDGALLSPRAVGMLRAQQSPLILYNNDDPTGKRDGNRFFQVCRTLSLYDLCVTLRKSTAKEMLQMGAARTMRVGFSYDEIERRPVDPDEPIPEEFLSDVCFVGTWMRGENRDHFLDNIRRAGLRLKIWGPRWEKSGCKQLVRDCWMGAWLSGREYVYAIAGAKVAIGLVSGGNRDDHTSRSVEIPYAGGLLCAVRTQRHTEMFKEGSEAIFWESPEECVRVCRELVADDHRRKIIVANGMRRVRELKVGNEDLCRKILSEVFA